MSWYRWRSWNEDERGTFFLCCQYQVEILLNSALHLCSVAASPSALTWAEELWQLASLAGSKTETGEIWRFEPNQVNFVTWLWFEAGRSCDLYPCVARVLPARFVQNVCILFVAPGNISDCPEQVWWATTGGWNAWQGGGAATWHVGWPTWCVKKSRSLVPTSYCCQVNTRLIRNSGWQILSCFCISSFLILFGQLLIRSLFGVIGETEEISWNTCKRWHFCWRNVWNPVMHLRCEEQCDWKPSPILLAALVHVAGEQRDPHRAEELWQRLQGWGSSSRGWWFKCDLRFIGS